MCTNCLILKRIFRVLKDMERDLEETNRVLESIKERFR